MGSSRHTVHRPSFPTTQASFRFPPGSPNHPAGPRTDATDTTLGFRVHELRRLLTLCSSLISKSFWQPVAGKATLIFILTAERVPRSRKDANLSWRHKSRPLKHNSLKNFSPGEFRLFSGKGKGEVSWRGSALQKKEFCHLKWGQNDFIPQGKKSIKWGVWRLDPGSVFEI